MYCTRCGVELRGDDNFCSRCGAQTQCGVAVAPRRALMLDKQNKKIAGVCAGFARYFDVDVVLMRILWLALAICTGIGFVAYIVAWIVMPSDEECRAQATLVRT